MASIYPNRKNGKLVSFKFKVFLRRDENGKQIFKCKTWTPQAIMTENKMISQAQKEAIIWERQIIEEYQKSIQGISSTEITLSDFVENHWLPSQMNNNEHRASTRAFHTYLLKIILNYLGKYQLKNITSNNIEEYLDYLKNTYKTKQNKPLSPKTIRHHYCTLNLIFEYAVKIDFIPQNPLAKVDTPKLRKQKVDALSREEVLIFLQEIEKLPLEQHLMYYLIITTGIRRGECFGLQWGDINFDNHTIRIERNVTYTSFDGITVGFPKTDTGIREIPLTDKVIDMLNKYKEDELSNFALSDNAFLFHSSESVFHPHEPTYLTKHLKRFMKQIGLPDMSPHDLRHTCATMLIQSGADIKSVQDILGHADASTTLNFYVKSNIDNMREATQKAFDF